MKYWRSAIDRTMKVSSYGKPSPFESLQAEEMNRDPPKTLADCFEAIIGAILVDCNYNLEVIDEVLTRLMDELFHTVPLDCPDDPISQLRHIQQGRYCHKLTSK